MFIWFLIVVLVWAGTWWLLGKLLPNPSRRRRQRERENPHLQSDERPRSNTSNTVGERLGSA